MQIGDKVLVFNLMGSMAHFRAYYTNSSSLSYGFPPRTAIIGIISAILGYERDSYYEKFSIDNCKIALSVKSPIRKLIQTVNYVRTKEEDGFGSYERAIKAYLNAEIQTYQTPLEIILPDSLTELRYRVYFWHKDENKEIFNSLKDKLKNSKSHFSISFGISEFLAWYEYIGEEEVRGPVSSAVSSTISESFFDQIDFPGSVGSSILVEKMPLELEYDEHEKTRKLKSQMRFVYDKNGKSIKFKNLKDVFHVSGDNIVFME